MTVEIEIKELKAKCEQHRADISTRLAIGSKHFTEIEGRIISLETWQERQNGSLQQMDSKLGDLLAAMTALQIDMATGRPSWAILALITTLFSSVAVLGTYIATH